MPVVGREIGGRPAASHIQNADPVTLLGEAQRGHATAETRTDHHDVVVICHCRSAADIGADNASELLLTLGDNTECIRGDAAFD